MGLFTNEYPYTDFHELNLDWMLTKIKELSDKYDGLEGDVDQIIQKWLAILTSRMTNLICVNDYGAKGDGVTDDTQAIQECIKANPNAHILFKKGVYIISDTIHIYSASGGQCIDLGGAVVRYSETSPFPDRNTPMFLTDLDGEEPGFVAITNGVIDGNGKAGIGFQNTTYYTSLSDLRLINLRYIGILNGKLNTTDNISSQMNINNVTINQLLGDWSLEDTYGMYFTNPDNLINNVNINRFGTGILVRTGGNEFNNIHITLQYRDTGLTDEQYQGVNINHFPFSAGQKQINTFNNCYFNAGRYIIKNTTSNFSASIIVLNNCQYTFYSSAATLAEDIYCYVLGGEYPCFVHCTNLESHHGNKVTLLGTFTDTYNASTLNFNNIECNSDSTLRGELLDVQNGGKTSKTSMYEYSLAPGECIEIGCVFRKLSIASISNNLASIIECIPGTARTAVADFYRNGNVWNSSTTQPYSKLQIHIANNPTYVEINGKQYHYFKVYLKNGGTSALSDTFELSIYGHLSNEYYFYPKYYDSMSVGVIEDTTRIL